MAKPNRTLRFGQPAIVPIEFAADEAAPTETRGAVSIVAQTPRKAPASLVAKLPAEMRPKRGQVVYYVPIVLTNVSPGSLEGYGGPKLGATLRSGGETAYQIGLGGVAGCDPHGAALSLASPGDTDQTCVIAAASPKDPLGQIQYAEAPYGYDNEFRGNQPDYNDSYNLGPITWR